MQNQRGWHWATWAVAILLLVTSVVAQIEAPIAGGAGAPIAQPLLPPQQKAALLRVDTTIDRVTLRSLERRVDAGRKAGCTLIIYDIDAAGGMMASAMEISAFTKRLAAEHLAVVAWVHGNAAGAPSLVALSCPLIVMADGGGVGSLGMVDLAPGAAPPPLIADLDDSAARAKVDPAVFRAMAIPGVELFTVANRTTGETRYVDRAGEQALIQEKSPLPGGDVARVWAETGQFDGPNTVLTALTADALKMGLSKATVNTEADLRAALNIRGDLLVMDMTFLERAARFLARPWIRFLLLVGTFTFAWMELSHPGISIPGILALICLALLLGGPFITGLAQSWEILLVLAGIGIVLADLFFVGSLGMLAVPGFILMAIGLVASFIPTGIDGGLEFGEGWLALRKGLTVVVCGMVVSLVAFALMARYLRMTPGFRRLQLAPAIAGAAGSVRDAADRPASDAVFVGALGLAHTQLRPAGKARFGEHLIDVVSFGPFINAGTEVEVVTVSGYRVTVRPYAARATLDPATPTVPSPDTRNGGTA
jgi:membrane-bound serine protease (ClpP class)